MRSDARGSRACSMRRPTAPGEGGSARARSRSNAWPKRVDGTTNIKATASRMEDWRVNVSTRYASGVHHATTDGSCLVRRLPEGAVRPLGSERDDVSLCRDR